MDTVGAYEAKTHLPKLLERVRNGESITITKHGVPVAVLSPPDRQGRIDPSELVDMIRSFRDSHRLDGLSIKEMIEEGRR
jgi:prevent-host-death family protein